MSDNSGSKYDILCSKCEGDYQAYLYDCDGTLADNMQTHKDAYSEVATEGSISLDTVIIDELAGLPTRQVVEEINKRYSTSFNPDEFAEKKAQAFFRNIDNTRPIDFVVQHLKDNAGKVKIGVVSGGSRRTVERTLSVLGISNLIDVLVCGNDIPRGKPHPDPFLLAAEKLGVLPDKCIVFEDGELGVQAAIAAGMKWIRIDKI
jgi:HAD superfamily hydrolase (TIGR01509 family)